MAKRTHDEPSGARKLRRGRSSVDGANKVTAISLGGVAAFKDVWAALTKAGSTSKKPTAKSLDTRFKYILPGWRHNGEEGVDFLLGELAVLRFVEVCASEVASSEASQDTSKTGGTVPDDSGGNAVGRMAGRIIGGRHVATARRSIRTAAVNIDDVEAVRNVGARVDEATGMATVAARDPRGGRGKARVRQSPSSCTGGGHEVCEGVNAGDAGGHTAVAGRVERGLGTGERRGGSTAQRAVRASSLAGVNCGGGGGDHGVRGGGV
ncbi:hypothetical protein F441_19518 [Phytophthora nicotianae CJ01A1]|uniref:Uncharacterized protein n=1 Tax=Phytophthora nicotianae CJ01A1 TaxID=1317063 RepID=W2VZE2_PHYNI|nr:hypothetical protein F441_19518 [Phytophthora nicotianae CJ01A1]